MSSLEENSDAINQKPKNRYFCFNMLIMDGLRRWMKELCEVPTSAFV